MVGRLALGAGVVRDAAAAPVSCTLFGGMMLDGGTPVVAVVAVGGTAVPIIGVPVGVVVIVVVVGDDVI